MRKSLAFAVTLWAGFYGPGGLKTACAAGFYLQEQSVSGLGTAFAGSAALSRDASIIYYNPAGMSDLDGTHVNAAAHVLVPYADLDDAGSTFGGSDSDDPIGVKAIPNFYISQQVSENFWLGLGVSLPFGLASTYEDDWFGRFDSIKNNLKTIDIQPSAAIRLTDWLSLGGGINVQYADAVLSSAVTDGQEGLSRLEGDALTFGYTLGVMVRPWTTTSIGVSYRSSVFHDLEGRALVTGTAASDFDIKANAKLTTPDIAGFGISHDLGERWRILAQANWFGWNNFDSIAVFNEAGGLVSDTPQNYQTTWSYALGAEYDLNERWTLRAGYQFDETPTTDEFRTTRTPDGDRHWVTAGGTYRLDERWSVDFAGAYIDVAEEEINVTRNSGAATVRADTDGKVGIFSLGVNYRF